MANGPSTHASFLWNETSQKSGNTKQKETEVTIGGMAPEIPAQLVKNHLQKQKSQHRR